MRKGSFVLTAVLAAAGIGVTATMLLPSAAMAQQTVGPNVGKHLKTAQDAIQRKRWDTALAEIKQAQAVTPRSAFEDYKINELLWYVYLQQGRNADAARVLEQEIASGQMPASERTQRTKTLAQLYFRAGNFSKGVQVGNDYLKAVPGDREIQMLVAQGYYQQKNYKSAISAANRLLQGGGQPSEDLLQLVLRANYELGDKAGTAKALEQLLRYYPTPETWASLLKTYFSQAKKDPEKIALYRLAEDVGSLTKPDEYIDMTEALVTSGAANEGKRVLEAGNAAKVFPPEMGPRVQMTLNTATKQATAEAAGLPAANKAVAAGASGEDMYKAGRLYFSTGDYAKAADALGKAIAKGGVSDLDDANMHLGIALARSNRKDDAIKAFDAVKDPNLAEIARLWKLKVRSPPVAPAAAPAAADDKAKAKTKKP